MTTPTTSARLKGPFQDDGHNSMDTTCRDHCLLERLHKQDAPTQDQIRHYESGWEAAVAHYFPLLADGVLAARGKT